MTIKQKIDMRTLTIKECQELVGVSYLGNVATSSKIAKSTKYNEDTYVLYLAPANSSGYEVCPARTEQCTDACLNESGHNRIDTQGVINLARVRKTQTFFENRELFMYWLIREIERHGAKADRRGRKFSVRLNGTSDIDIRRFKFEGRTVLQLFPEVQFYDYTKVYERLYLDEIDNYDLTFSFSGKNLKQTLSALEHNYRVAVVFQGPDLPKYWHGYPVIDGDKYDMRYVDPQGVVAGLRFKRVRNNIDTTANPFIIPNNDPNIVW